MKLKHLIAAAIALTMALAACNDEEKITSPAEKTGVTITAGIEKEAQTRISYQKDGQFTKITWDALELFHLIGPTMGEGEIVFRKVGEETGSTTANFSYNSGSLPTTPPVGTFYAAYAQGVPVTANVLGFGKEFDRQNGTGKSEQIMIATIDNTENTLTAWDDLHLTFRPKTPLLKLTLKNAAFAGKAVTDITLSAPSLATRAGYSIADDEWTTTAHGDITITQPFTGTAPDGAVTLYIAQPTTTTETGKITITARCDEKFYVAELSTGTFSTVAMYDAAVEMKENPNLMQFTIQVPEGGGKYTMPFMGLLASGVKVTIHWGENNKTTEIVGTDKTIGKLAYTYTTGGPKQITLISSADAASQQIPRLSFDTYDQGLWLISMDTPMLYMGWKDLSVVFSYCRNLTTIGKELFYKNTTATSFLKCFESCTSLTTIPGGLFDKNAEATGFEGCFKGCTNLASVPKFLFAENKAALNFKETFSECSKLVLNPDIFCDTTKEGYLNRFNGKGMTFNSCFYSVGSSQSVTDGGTAPALWTYEFGNKKPTTMDCFYNCTKVSNAKAILGAWK